jgi:protein-tyrosine-phosphatase
MTLRDSRYRVCFVCTGNICRSPMAEAVFRGGYGARCGQAASAALERPD